MKGVTEGEYCGWVTLGSSSGSMAFRIWVSLSMEHRSLGGHPLDGAHGSLSPDQISGPCSSLDSSPCTYLPDSPQPCRLSVNEAGLGWLPRYIAVAVAAGFYQ